MGRDRHLPQVDLFLPRFVGRIGLADGVSLVTACLGMTAAAVAPLHPGLAARLLLLATMADALDGIVARRYGGTEAGPLFDSLSDAVAFGVAPAVFVLSVAQAQLGLLNGTVTWPLIVAVAAAMAFVAMAVVRLALYTTYDTGRRETQGMQTTLATTVLAAGYLSGLFGAVALVGGLAVFAYLMSIRVPYPDLLLKDALLVGLVQCGAVAAPAPYHQWFAVAVFAFAVVYATLAPRYYVRVDDIQTTDEMTAMEAG